ncbi:MAG: aspartate--tRNA ligase [Puniceicoccales bacterium]|jgi:aspartyl-tRNA synthetase|nr:aspartate--tRNA ligase [Puniceicoccales bacterium]
MKRTHHCNALREAELGQRVRLIGWIQSIRDHGGLMFIDLRDREGVTQIVCDPNGENFRETSPLLKEESVVEIAGKVCLRPEDARNERMVTGVIEVLAEELIIHNIAETLPFPIHEKSDKVSEDLRLTYRYLDLRRSKNLARLRLRHQITRAVRQFLDQEDFIEIETPVLFKTTPEGAREFLVPSRLNPGNFYALTQSPQQYKQMLMVAGVERYYSLARCFRDEDLRADRQQEFTQIDLEMSFIDREDMYELVEGMLSKVWETALGIPLKLPFRHMTFREAMDNYGSDKPDTRWDFPIRDISEVFRNSSFKVFRNCLEEGGVIKAINMKGLADITQGELQHCEEVARSLGAKGLAYRKYEEGIGKSPIEKFFSEEEKKALAELLEVEEGDIVFFAANRWEKACTILGRIRLEAIELLLKRQKIVRDSTRFDFLWVVDFPLMTYDEEQGRYLATHHPFTAPLPEDESQLWEKPECVRGQHYDIVLNGVELGGGSIRVHRPELQRRIFQEVLQIPEEVVENRFGYMIRAFRYGAPPHGGIALGLDRMVAMLAGTESIRDVIAFPKTQSGQELMTASPTPVSEKQLQDLWIASVAEAKK